VTFWPFSGGGQFLVFFSLFHFSDFSILVIFHFHDFVTFHVF